MMAEHTPGPWAVSEIGITNDGGKPVTFGDIESDNYGRVCLVTMQSDAKRGEAWRTPCPIRDANARLIAAAPDLLALVIQYRDDLRYPPRADSIERRLEAIDRALAKVQP